MICVSLTSPNTDRMVVDIKRAAEVADLVELRLDYMEECDLRRILESRPCPVVVTNRPVSEGGRFRGGEEERVGPLLRAIELGADYVDIERDSIHLIRERGETRLIVSYHNFRETPKNLPKIYAELREKGADIVKLAVWAREIEDNLVVFDVLMESDTPTIAICMGELGLPSRILALKFGAFLTFAALGSGPVAGPGQIAARDMKEIYRAHLISPYTKIYGHISPSAETSPLVAAFNSAFKARGLDGVYMPFRVEKDVGRFVKSFSKIDVRGYTVAPSHQEGIGRFLDGLDASAERAGRVNTVVNRDGRLIGYRVPEEELISSQFRLWTGLEAPLGAMRGNLL
ncbi:MAG: type I 3-dehydroquinate dehydratase [bacterium]